MTKASIPTGSVAALVAEKEALLRREQHSRAAAEARAVKQIQRLAENNAALARTNNRLVSQLEKLRGDHESLDHLATGQRAVFKTKEAELAKEISGLKHLLKETIAGRQALHAQLMAKQEVVGYLEWRLAQAQRLAEEKNLPLGLQAQQFDVAARIAAGELPDDSFAVLADDSTAASASTQSSSASGRAFPRTLLALGQRGLVGIPATAWAASGAPIDKENVQAEGPPSAPRLDPSPLRGTPRGPLADITPPRHDVTPPAASFVQEGTTPISAAGPSTTRSLFQGPEPAVEEGDEEADVEVVDEAGEISLAVPGELSLAPSPAMEAPVPTAESAAVEKEGSEKGQVEQQQTEASVVEEGGAGLVTPQRLIGDQLVGAERDHLSAAQVTPGSDAQQQRRTSSRARRVSYALPSVNRKLRQGDPFTFGDPGGSDLKKQAPRSRTKPRAKHTTTPAPGSGRSKGSRRSGGGGGFAQILERNDDSDVSGEEF